jgi:hypothetical protein
MTVLAVLIPVAFLGFIVWFVVGVKQRSSEPPTVAAAAAFYARLVVIVGTTMALLGGAVAVKALLGFINIAWSYAGSSLGITSSTACPTGAPQGFCPPQPTQDFTPQRTQDVVLAITLVSVGLLAAAVHVVLGRRIRHRPGGSPDWVQRGSSVAFATLYGFAALYALAGAVYAIVTYIVLPSGAPTSFFGVSTGTTSAAAPFGDVAGAAAFFIPAWVVAALLLLRRVRAGASLPVA